MSHYKKKGSTVGIIWVAMSVYGFIWVEATFSLFCDRVPYL
ncbi:MAG: hypothetical protein ACXAEX_23005 [Promethearchaeota archaeon]